jgi:nucleotide-binding universal stress UspA family protein
MKPNKIKRVLIALDYNPTAQKVAEIGFSMAKSMKADVILLHVISDPLFYSVAGYSPIMGFAGYMDMSPVQLNSIEELKSSSLHFLDKSRHHLGNKNIKIIVKEGDFAGSILETAEEVRADIIVVGSHSRKWLENIVIGSVTEKVLHQTSVPLFIIPTRQKD